MAIFHFSAQVISRNSGGNSVAAAAYRAGARFVCARTGLVFNRSRRTDVVHRAILAPQGTAPWAFCRQSLHDKIEAVERRINSQLVREVEVALPIELTNAQRAELIHRYVNEQFVAHGMVADIAVHDKGTGNPHAHVLLTLRDVGPEGFGAKRRDWNNLALVSQWREAWATTCNAALEDAGHAERIDHRSHEARGLDIPATVHLGRKTYANAEAWNTRAEFNAWVQTQVALAKTRSDVQRVQSQIVDVTTTLAQALAAREAQRKSGECGAPFAPNCSAGASNPSRIWTPADAMSARDFSIAGLMARRAADASRPTHRSTPLPEVLHGSDGFTQGDTPC
jgi:MobA/MobL family